MKQIWSYARGNLDGSVTVHGAVLIDTWWRPADHRVDARGRSVASGFNGAGMMSEPWRGSTPGGPW